MNNLLLLSLNIHAPFATPSSFNDRSLQLEEEDRPDHHRKIKKSYTKGGLFAIANALATERVMIKKRKLCVLMEEDNNNKKKRKMPKKMERVPVVNNESIVQLKRFITGEMGGLDMKLVIQKILYESDMKKDQSRLNMPILQLKTQPHQFLTDEEMRMVDESKDGMEVRVVGSKLRMYERPLWLKKWHLEQTDKYVLKTNWNKFVADNEDLKKDTMIQVWAFRKNRKLCFAIVPVERPDAVNNAA
ncbi:putative DNA-binding pseudobarrel domain superfamily [Helianthus annuus]|uniref:DNA-binding pseudobarrel domain superfamily n=1 Tax=Helianthus annuus TaxID=4232 RepID=A0A251S3M7_HELAN|nr:B3 domain-containing protein At1g05920 [Helianthus annuus]KAF5762094.1 putative DNA-binding pseudobarrel domain superfamily [Helianthus annuus]KAJ0439842.1 putative DNA-binding pseudobarrel domain superfamily [Helianthus annuus]KAJ0462231.1 putative DNA-binding pseudobarrel domain superfamily [Helianthus annuus]KAJ0642620.1 putative DNA-binding pseudobarrel domain superfamily [Helianthus annuus]KAJ0646496.1 putative DNA-binding pseudobarrel domain superfamily [Helianthus annuus]